MSFVRFFDVIGLRVILREDCMDTNIRRGRAASDADRDLAAVGDEQVRDLHTFTREFGIQEIWLDCAAFAQLSDSFRRHRQPLLQDLIRMFAEHRRRVTKLHR